MASSGRIAIGARSPVSPKNRSAIIASWCAERHDGAGGSEELDQTIVPAGGQARVATAPAERLPWLAGQRVAAAEILWLSLSCPDRVRPDPPALLIFTALRELDLANTQLTDGWSASAVRYRVQRRNQPGEVSTRAAARSSLCRGA